jgi:hypothetical protein
MSYTTNLDLVRKANMYGLPLVAVLSKDDLPATPKDGYYIINLEDEVSSSGMTNDGSHWVGVGIDNGKAVYWDSYGVSPPVEVQRFLAKYIPYQYATKMVQSPRSGWCGMYQLFFIAFMTRQRARQPDINKRFQCFLSLWSKDYDDNLTRLKKYIKPFSLWKKT